MSDAGPGVGGWPSGAPGPGGRGEPVGGVVAPEAPPDDGAEAPAPPPLLHPRPSIPAVVSVVVSLAWLGGLASLVGITLGVIGLKETEDPERTGRAVAWIGVILGVAGAAATLVLALTLSVHDAGSTTAAPSSCVVQLRAVDKAFQAFEGANGLPPQTAADLIAGGLPRRDTELYTVVPESISGEGAIGLTAKGLAVHCPPPTPMPSVVGPPVQTATTSVGPPTTDLFTGAGAAACKTDLQEIEEGAALYMSINERAPSSIGQILSGQHSEWYVLGPQNGGQRLQVVRTPAGIQAHCPIPPNT